MGALLPVRQLRTASFRLAVFLRLGITFHRSLVFLGRRFRHSVGGFVAHKTYTCSPNAIQYRDKSGLLCQYSRINSDIIPAMWQGCKYGGLSVPVAWNAYNCFCSLLPPRSLRIFCISDRAKSFCLPIFAGTRYPAFAHDHNVVEQTWHFSAASLVVSHTSSVGCCASSCAFISCAFSIRRSAKLDKVFACHLQFDAPSGFYHAV